MSNAIQLQTDIDLYIDRTRNQRYPRQSYDIAVRDAVRLFIEERAGDKKQRVGGLSYKSEQQVSDELFTLQSQQIAAPTADVALYPSDYYFLTSVYATIGGVRTVVLPVNDNRLGMLLKNSFDAPSDIKPYYFQMNTGFQIFHGSGTISTVEVNYLIQPSAFTIGNDGQLISAGVTLTISSVYIATQLSVSAGITYNPGDEFTASTTTLTSGQVILKSATVDLNTPLKTRAEIAKQAAAILVGSSQEWNKAKFIQTEAEKS